MILPAKHPTSPFMDSPTLTAAGAHIYHFYTWWFKTNALTKPIPNNKVQLSNYLNSRACRCNQVRLVPSRVKMEKCSEWQLSEGEMKREGDANPPFPSNQGALGGLFSIKPRNN